MKKDVIIQVCDKQKTDGETECMEISVIGTMDGFGKDYVLEYTEYDGEMTGCKTKIAVADARCVSVMREGPYATEMTLEAGKRHSCHYETPYGSFMIGIFTRSVQSAMTEQGGSLSMEYTIDFNNGLAAENLMTITVTEGK